MKKKFLALGLTTALFLTACGAETTEEEAVVDETNEPAETELIKVASHVPPMTDIVEIAGEVIEEGYEVELVEVSDNVNYNDALLHGDVDANFAQHEPYMEMFNEERDGNLVALQTMYNAIVGYYSPVYDSIDEIENGIEVAVPSDGSNLARALMVLEQNDLIGLDQAVTPYEAGIEDISENPYEFEFTEIDLLNLTAAYEDGVPLVFNYPTYIDKIDLTPADALFLEKDPDYTFAIQLISREDIEDSDKIKALHKAFTSAEVHDFLEELAEKGHLEPAFEK